MNERDLQSSLKKLFNALPEEPDENLDRNVLQRRLLPLQWEARTFGVFEWLEARFVPLTVGVCFLVILMAVATIRQPSVSYEEVFVDAWVVAALPSSMDNPNKRENHEIH
ncbi:MAG: hypothetical protein H3C47_12020 [Candidatus Cloacimonetes bacterium]|nr:hypothetical protein [Candidatus Cloacimonadota bacterium]